MRVCILKSIAKLFWVFRNALYKVHLFIIVISFCSSKKYVNKAKCHNHVILVGSIKTAIITFKVYILNLLTNSCLLTLSVFKWQYYHLLGNVVSTWSILCFVMHKSRSMLSWEIGCTNASVDWMFLIILSLCCFQIRVSVLYQSPLWRHWGTAFFYLYLSVGCLGQNGPRVSSIKLMNISPPDAELQLYSIIFV